VKAAPRTRAVTLAPRKYALDTGESCATIEKALPPATTGIKATADGYFYIDPAVFHAGFASDLPQAKADFMAISQVLISADSFTHAVRLRRGSRSRPGTWSPPPTVRLIPIKSA
jgi:hypothetical protein